MFMFFLLVGAQAINAIPLQITNNLNESIEICANGDEDHLYTVSAYESKEITKFVPDSIKVRKIGGIYHASRMQKALDNIIDQLKADPSFVSKPGACAFIDINVGPSKILHPFAFESGLRQKGGFLRSAGQ